MAEESRDKQSQGQTTPLTSNVNMPPSPNQLNYRTDDSAGIVRGTGADWFGPLNPLEPTAPEEVKGRILDFPSGYNLNLRPRAYEGITFEQLRAFADSYDLLRLVIETRKDQMARRSWNIVARDPKKRDQSDPALQEQVQRIERFFLRPDGVNFWSDWLRMVIEDLLVLDAPAIYRRRTFGGDLYALEPIDGATIKRVIDDWGRTPQYPVAAYQQILKGLPAVNYTTQDLIYRPRNSRTHKVYGLSPVEQIVMTINIGIRRQVWQLQSFTEGNIPEALIGTPDTWTPDQIRSFQDWFDGVLEGNTGERRRARFVPGEISKGYVATKPSELFGQAEEWLARVVCYAFSISPQPFVAMMNRSTAETAQESATMEGLAPLEQWVKALIDTVIIEDFGSFDLEFQWFDEDEIDPAIKSAIIDRELGSGVLTFNEARAEKGLDPFQHPDADRPMFRAATGYTPIFLTPEEQAANDAMQAQISGQVGPDGEPLEEEGAPVGEEGGEPAGIASGEEAEDEEGGEPAGIAGADPTADGEQDEEADAESELEPQTADQEIEEEDDEEAKKMAKREYERDEKGRFGSGGGGGDSAEDKGSGGMPAGMPPKMTDEKMRELIDGQRGQTVDQLHEKAVENQIVLKDAGLEIQGAIPGVEFVLPPGPDNGVKSLSGAKEKLERKDNYGPEKLTDLARATFVADTPEAAHEAAAALATAFGGKVFDEGWQVQEGSQYMDRKALIQFPDKTVGEVQFMSRGMYNAKYKEGGHDLYELVRDKDTSREDAVRYEAQMRELYGKADAGTAFEGLGKSA